MSLIDRLNDVDTWEKFYRYKMSLGCPKRIAKRLRVFIDEKRFESVYDCVVSGVRFPLPQKSVISKMSTQKKRTVYTYPEDENMVLKLLTYLLLRKYDYLFESNLYSFRPGRTVKDAIRCFLRTDGIGNMYSYKVDISNYFNSVPVDRLVPVMEEVLSDDPELLCFLKGLLEEEFVLDQGVEIKEQKGIMAGVPLASFFANLYLRELDSWFAGEGVPYARYSDDIILFAQSPEEVERYAQKVCEFLTSKGLSVNPSKECYSTPEDGWVFLGFSFRSGAIDIAPASVDKIKAKMRRKTRALMRWSKRRGEPAERAAAAFIRIFNKKLFEKTDDNDLTWSLWYFPVINTTESLVEIDHYAQDCLRYLLTGKHTKSRFNVKYEDLKELGYKSLVNEYYKVDECE